MNPVQIQSPRLADPVAQNTYSSGRNTKTQVEAMAADFEAIFVRQMLKTMRSTSLSKGLFDGQGTEQFQDMQDSMLAEKIAEKGVFGVAELLSRHVESKNV